MIKHGPVDVFVMAAGHPAMDGSVLAELERLSNDQTIRVLDAMLLLKNDDGSTQRLELRDLPGEQFVTMSFMPAGSQGLFDSEDAATLIEGMVPGSAVFALPSSTCGRSSSSTRSMMRASNWRFTPVCRR